MKSVLCCCLSPVLASPWNQTRSVIFWNGTGFSFFLFERAQEKKRESGANAWKKWLFLTHCRKCLWERKIVCYRLSHLGLDLRHLLRLRLHPAAAPFEQEGPYNSCSFLSHRLSPTHLCLPQVKSAKGNGEETKVFLLHFPAGNLHCYCKPSQAHRAASGSCREPWWPLSHEVSSEGEMRLVAKAGICGSWVCVTWTT